MQINMSDRSLDEPAWNIGEVYNFISLAKVMQGLLVSDYDISVCDSAYKYIMHINYLQIHCHVHFCSKLYGFIYMHDFGLVAKNDRNTEIFDMAGVKFLQCT